MADTTYIIGSEELLVNGEVSVNNFPSNLSTTLKGDTLDVPTAGTAVQLPDYPCQWITIIAKDTNMGYIYVGGSDVSSSNYGVRLRPGESFDLNLVANNNLIYITSSVDGEGISYLTGGYNMASYTQKSGFPLALNAGTYLLRTTDNGDILVNSASAMSLRKPTVFDSFNRADSNTSLGNADLGFAWTAVQGTWGIQSNKAYSVSGVSADLALMDSGKIDANIFATLSGSVIETANVNSMFGVIFRALDASNFLMARIARPGSAATAEIQIYKNVAGTLTKLAFLDVTSLIANGADYELNVYYSGSTIRVYLNGVYKIGYTLQAGESQFLAYTKVGFRLSFGGTPTFFARADKFLLEELA